MSSAYTLAYGTHATAEDGRCAMEWVSHLAAEPHGDAPKCVSPVLRAFCVELNDGLPQEPRQRLRPYLTRTIGTAGDGLDPERAWMSMDWLIRTYTPAWLSLAGLHDAALELRAAAPVVGLDELRATRERLGIARRGAADRWHAGRAVRLGRGRVSARATAWSPPAAAAWAAARCCLGDMAGDHARAAARAIAGDAAATAMRAARSRNRGGEAEQAAHCAVAPTLRRLQESAFALLGRLLPTVAVALPEPSHGERTGLLR